MDAESSINSSKLEITFREQVKQYRALLRWGVDKVFQDTGIDILFTDARQMLDEKDDKKASEILLSLKNQINILEDQYPVQKNQIELTLYSQIQQLELVLEKSKTITSDNVSSYLQTLEISRVAIQNDDWAEARKLINAVETDVLEQEVTDAVHLSTQEQDPVIENAQIRETRNVSAPLVTDTPETDNNVDTNGHDLTKVVSPSETPLKNKTNVSTKWKAQVKTETAVEETNAKFTPGPVSRALAATAIQSAVGKLVNTKELEKTFQTLNKSNINNLRIALVGSPETINTELACFSRNSLKIKLTGSQVVLLRLSISRDLAIYLIGIPVNENTNPQQICEIAPQLSAIFFNTADVNDKNIAPLKKALPDLIASNEKIFVKTQCSNQLFEDASSHNAQKITAFTDDAIPFILNAAQYLESYSDLK